MKIKASCSNGANWKQVNVKSRIPEELDKLEELARNMWWAWNHDARMLFRSLDEDLYEEVGQNPVLLLERLSYEKMEALAKADKMSKQIGLKGLNRRIINDGIQDIAQGAETFDNAIKQNVADKTKIKIDPQRLSTNDTANMVKGLKKVHKTAAVTKQTQNVFLDDMKVADLIEIGKKRDVQKTAEIILEKSGRKDAKTPEKKKKREKEKQQIKTALKETKVRS